MTSIASFFENNLVLIFFFYGLAFFSMGFAVWLEMGRYSEFHRTRALFFLAAFGMLHGFHEWSEIYSRMLQLAHEDSVVLLVFEIFRVALLALSFIMLLLFGLSFVFAEDQSPINGRLTIAKWAAALVSLWLVTVIVILWLYRPCGSQCVTAVDVLIRYFLAIPAALFATWAMVLQRRDFTARGMHNPARDMGWAAVALFLYGVVGQIFTKSSFLLPSTVINADLFQQAVGIPVQVFRAVFAVLVALFVIRALRAFEIERQQRFIAAIEATSIAQQKTLATQEQSQKEMKALNEELKAREALRGELLHQVVTAQEAERQRIARELHDGVGQTLTALGMGLAAASKTVQTNPEVGARQLTALKEMSTQLTQEMSRIMAGLRPSSLTDLGLIPALRSQIQAFEKQSGATVNFIVDGRQERIPPELETIIFRITQESLNNIVKHADAERVTVRVGYNEEDVHLMIKDDGRGFDTDEALRPDPQNRWGLIGIQERVRIVRGDCTINSETDEGTIIRACIPLNDGVCECLQ